MSCLTPHSPPRSPLQLSTPPHHPLLPNNTSFCSTPQVLYNLLDHLKKVSLFFALSVVSSELLLTSISIAGNSRRYSVDLCHSPSSLASTSTPGPALYGHAAASPYHVSSNALLSVPYSNVLNILARASASQLQGILSKRSIAAGLREVS